MTVNSNLALWEKGNFTRIAASMRESEALVQGLSIKPDMKVLDVGCGDGTTALPAATLGADVLGSTSHAISWKRETSAHRRPD